MDWKAAIDINRQALARIVAGLVALLSAQNGAVRLALPVYEVMARLLLPTESAVRRLIVMMARGLVAPPPIARPMPKGHIIVRKGMRGSFQLFDTRKQFSENDTAPTPPVTGPRIRTVDDPSPREQFLAHIARPRSNLSSAVETAHLTRRLMILKRALETLPRQALRMVRWQARRAAMQNPKFTSPLRPGAPPGSNRRRRDPIDKVLAECHALARYALNPNSS